MKPANGFAQSREPRKRPKKYIGVFRFFQKFKNRANLIYPEYTESELMQLNHYLTVLYEIRLKFNDKLDDIL